MAYEALARKWRPKTFDEIVGQGHVTRALSNAITSGKIHHAYLFSGTRGVGKTTFARILARALNCEKGPTPTPCLTCPSCAEVGSGTDVQEIDGASNTGIDDIRSLRENAAYAPSRLRYKVYIIDEVHMLSKQAFNGLLKTLEEPPPHVVFILATTEPNRIPDTILSRVQRFDFRMLTDAEVRGRLSEMARVEGISAEEDALALMARYAFGSMRDGQSLFEQAAVSGGGSVTAALVEGMLGLVGVEAAIDLVSAAVLDGAGAALTRFASLLSRGADLKYLFLSLIDVLRDAAVLSFTGQEALLFRHSPASLDRMRELTARRSREEWMLLLDIAFRSERDVLATEFPHLGFELLLLRLANARGLLSVEALEAGDAPAARPASLPADRPVAATFSRKPAPRVDAPVSVTVPPVLPAAGVPQQREARIAPLPTPIGGTPPARSSLRGGGGETLPRTKEAADPLHLRAIFLRPPMQEQGRQETGSSASAPYRAAESSGRRRTVPGMHHPQELHAQPLLRGARYDLGEARIRKDESEPAVRGKEPGRRREELRKRAGHLVPRRLLPRIRVSTPVSRPAVRRIRYHQVERTGLDPGDLPPKIPRDGEQPPVQAIVAEIPAREIEQVSLEIHAGAGAEPGAETGKKEQENTASGPEIEDRSPAIGGGEPRENHGVDREAVPPLRLPDDQPARVSPGVHHS